MSLAFQSLDVPAFCDMHVHFRQDRFVEQYAPWTARSCAWALAMPNTIPPILNAYVAEAYRRRIEAAGDGRCQVIPAIKLAMDNLPMVGDRAGLPLDRPLVYKVYPTGVTHNSERGMDADLFTRLPLAGTPLALAFAKLAEHEAVLCLHPELPGPGVLFREERFFTTPLVRWLLTEAPFRVVFEHLSTAAAVDAVREAYHIRSRTNVAATITLHHLTMTLDDVIGDQVQIHNFCKPVAKLHTDRAALREAVRSPAFFLGSDSAPHTREGKRDGCAGCFTAPLLAERLVTVLEEAGLLDWLEGFTSRRALGFYRLAPIARRLCLLRAPERAAELASLVSRDQVLEARPWGNGFPVRWLQTN